MSNMKTLLESMNHIIEGSWEDDEAADKAAFDMQPKTNICPDCEGGRYDPEGECETCGGAGEIFEDGIEEGRDVREMTNKIYQAMDEEMLDPRTVAEAALAFMSESQVADMASDNGWFEYEDEEEFESVEEAGFTGPDDHDFLKKSNNQHRSAHHEITGDEITNIEVEGVDSSDYPDFVDAFVTHAEWKKDGRTLTDEELERIDPAVAQEAAMDDMIGAGEAYSDAQRDSGMMGEDNLGEDPWGLGQ